MKSSFWLDGQEGKTFRRINQGKGAELPVDFEISCIQKLLGENGTPNMFLPPSFGGNFVCVFP